MGKKKIKYVFESDKTLEQTPHGKLMDLRSTNDLTIPNTVENMKLVNEGKIDLSKVDVVGIDTKLPKNSAKYKEAVVNWKEYMEGKLFHTRKSLSSLSPEEFPSEKERKRVSSAIGKFVHKFGDPVERGEIAKDKAQAKMNVFLQQRAKTFQYPAYIIAESNYRFEHFVFSPSEKEKNSENIAKLMKEHYGVEKPSLEAKKDELVIGDVVKVIEMTDENEEAIIGKGRIQQMDEEGVWVNFPSLHEDETESDVYDPTQYELKKMDHSSLKKWKKDHYVEDYSRYFTNPKAMKNKLVEMNYTLDGRNVGLFLKAMCDAFVPSTYYIHDKSIALLSTEIQGLKKHLEKYGDYVSSNMKNKMDIKYRDRLETLEKQVKTLRQEQWGKNIRFTKGSMVEIKFTSDKITILTMTDDHVALIHTVIDPIIFETYDVKEKFTFKMNIHALYSKIEKIKLRKKDTVSLSIFQAPNISGMTKTKNVYRILKMQINDAKEIIMTNANDFEDKDEITISDLDNIEYLHALKMPYDEVKRGFEFIDIGQIMGLYGKENTFSIYSDFDLKTHQNEVKYDVKNMKDYEGNESVTYPLSIDEDRMYAMSYLRDALQFGKITTNSLPFTIWLNDDGRRYGSPLKITHRDHLMFKKNGGKVSNAKQQKIFREKTSENFFSSTIGMKTDIYLAPRHLDEEDPAYVDETKFSLLERLRISSVFMIPSPQVKDYLIALEKGTISFQGKRILIHSASGTLDLEGTAELDHKGSFKIAGDKVFDSFLKNMKAFSLSSKDFNLLKIGLVNDVLSISIQLQSKTSSTLYNITAKFEQDAN